MRNFNFLPSNKRIRFLLIPLFISLFIYLFYSFVSNLSYPISNWKTYTSKDFGLEFRYPDNVRITKTRWDFLHVTDEKIKHPDVFRHPEDLAFKKTYSCPGMSGICTDSVLNGFFIIINKTSPPPIVTNNHTDFSFQFEGYKILTLDGYKAYRKEKLSTFFPRFEKKITVYILKGNNQINIETNFPVNEKMYSRLFDQIISTIKFVK